MRNNFKSSLMVALTILIPSLSYASTNIIVTAPARHIETCHHSVCSQHQVSPASFAIPVYSAKEVTLQEIPTNHILFFNPNGMPSPKYTKKYVSKLDCVYRMHVLKVGGQALGYDKKTGTHWRRICLDIHGHGVMGPAVR